MNKRTLVETYWSAEKAKKLEDVLSYYAEDAVFEAPGVRHEGRQNIRTFYEDIINNYKDLTVTITRTTEEEDRIAVQYVCDLVCHDGEQRRAEGCNVFTIREDRIQSLRCYFNPADF